MKRLIASIVLAFPVLAHATITGPTTSSTGSFTLSWGQDLWETTSTGAYIQNISAGAPHTFFRPVGTYYFAELYCFWQPFVGWDCYTLDTHQVSVSAVAYPESLSDQADYQFEIRSGDLNGDGTLDLHVERTTSGPPDGSMQSYIVWKNPNGTLSTGKSTPGYAATAHSYPINSTLNLMLSDVNADGYADHFIERIDQVIGVSEQEMVVFAPGTNSDKSKPAGSTLVNDEFNSFFADLARWLNDEDYFAENINNTTYPVFTIYHYCLDALWATDSLGLHDGVCLPVPVPIGSIVVQTGVNLDAMSVASHMENIINSGVPPTDNQLWQISQVFFSLFGVHSFGFDASGTRYATNLTPGDLYELDERIDTWMRWMWYAAQFLDEPGVSTHDHDYTVETPICNLQAQWCTLENIACWGRRFNAPLKQSGYDTPVQNGQYQVLDNPLGGEDPIRTGVGQAAGLPDNAIANITQENHLLHNGSMGDWPACPQPVPNQGTGTPPAQCNQIYREPYVDATNGTINMRTRGTGENWFDTINQAIGPVVVEGLDEAMIDGILSEPSRMCPELP